LLEELKDESAIVEEEEDLTGSIWMPVIVDSVKSKQGKDDPLDDPNV